MTRLEAMLGLSKAELPKITSSVVIAAPHWLQGLVTRHGPRR
jgi:hypothetical protein